MNLVFLGWPLAFQYARTSRIMASFDSEPPDVSITRLRPLGAILASLVASWTVGTAVGPISVGAKASLFICVVTARLISLRPCPTCTFHSDDRPSMYFLPAVSHR